jgi:type II pantothenate kinase
MGTGTAYVYADKNGSEYLGGTGVGGGTLMGLSKKLLGMSDPEQIAILAEQGDLSNIDLRINDISKSAINSILSDNATAANFGKVSDLATREDIALGIFNMVYETIGMLAVFAARQKELKEIVLIGNLAGLPHAHITFDQLNRMFGMHFIIPEMSTYGTVIGAALTR